MAQTVKAELILLNVILPITDNGEYPDKIIAFAKKNLKDRATTQLRKLTTYYPNKDEKKLIQHNVSKHYLVKEGIFIPTILQTAEELKCDLIIAGAKSDHYFSKLILGSTVRELIRKTTIPTLVIPEGFVYQPIQTIAFATALTGNDEKAILGLRQFAKRLKASVQSFFISELPYDYSNQIEEIWESRSLPKEEGQLATVKMIRKATFKAGIDYYLDNYPTDILAMFIPKRNFINQLFHISKTQQMVLNTNIPLLVYHS